uniref:Uncharacterized protein n=1 Tax=Tanacetum cinerariifolium TaxID=118510 RepID=A0A6L2K9U8_TANCI|nr:hypothetical protein [Tanacetum cinerariifolium]
MKVDFQRRKIAEEVKQRDLNNLTSNVLIPLDSWTSGLLVFRLPLSVRITKVIEGEFKKIKVIKVEDVSLTYDTPLEIFNMEVSRLSRMDNDLFTYEVKVANIPCNLIMNDDSKNEVDDDMGGDYEIELTDKESYDDEKEIA